MCVCVCVCVCGCVCVCSVILIIDNNQLILKELMRAMPQLTERNQLM